MGGNSSLELPPADFQYSPFIDETLLTPSLQQGMAELLRAYDYAQYTRRNLWSFAVEIELLRQLGLDECDFRWLTCLGFVEHAREITRVEDDGREFRSTGKLTFAERSCFILTEKGAEFARLLEEIFPAPRGLDGPETTRSFPAETKSNAPPVPEWDPERRELRVEGKVVKQFKWPAINQETILMAFQEDGWAARVDDPLPPQPDLDPRRRLHDTLKCLNRNQRHKRIHFRGDGTGEGIIWELLPDPKRAGTDLR